VQEVGVKRDCTRANEELSACGLPDVRKKMPDPVDVMLAICILLSSTGFAELHQELLGWGLLFLLGAACCEEHAVVCCVQSDNLIITRCYPDPPIAL
jgi:hypothetical protein